MRSSSRRHRHTFVVIPASSCRHRHSSFFVMPSLSRCRHHTIAVAPALSSHCRHARIVIPDSLYVCHCCHSVIAILSSSCRRGRFVGVILFVAISMWSYQYSPALVVISSSSQLRCHVFVAVQSSSFCRSDSAVMSLSS